tara:strand:- start:249 stop:1187 length:939 start_codon:yes stop_codon:yes gene_type:complete
MNLKEKYQLLNKFPDIELSYEKKLHKKVQNIDCYITIPYGAKYFAWFCLYKNKPSLIILKIDRKNNKIISIEKKICCFKSNLCIGVGTIFYGTIFIKDDVQFFNIEDIFYYKNKDLKKKCNLEKFQIEYLILKNEIKQIIYQKNDIIFGLPIISENYNEIFKKINDIPYRLFSIQHRFLKKNINIFYNESVLQKLNIFAIFRVEATIKPDIYKLYCYKNEKLFYYGLSHISSFKNSVFLNSLFRNIKENRNLDFLEESDDDEEFENIALDKYIKNIHFNMKCKYIKKFKSWEPIMRSDENISKYKFIISMEK